MENIENNVENTEISILENIEYEESTEWDLAEIEEGEVYMAETETLRDDLYQYHRENTVLGFFIVLAIGVIIGILFFDIFSKKWHV